MHLPQLPSVGKESLPVTMSVKETIKWFKIQMSGGWEGLEWVKRGGIFHMNGERERERFQKWHKEMATGCCLN